MIAGTEADLSGRFTGLSDRFRSLWTFYQFLGGVFKHQSRGSIPFEFDFQALYRRLQEAVPAVGAGTDPETSRALDHIERELDRVHAELAAIEAEFPPSLLRRFFDHLKNQDEKILFALVKFYLLQPELDRDTLDKLDILLTRMGEVRGEADRVTHRDRTELRESFARLARLTPHRVVEPDDRDELLARINGIRHRVSECPELQDLLESGLFESYRSLKQELGSGMLDPDLAVAIVGTNIDVKNRFQTLYSDEETRILEDTNRVFEIIRYLEKNPNLAHEQLRQQVEVFRESRERFDAGRRDHNVKREDIKTLKRSMQQVLDTFETGRGLNRPRAANAQATAANPTPNPAPATPTAPPGAGPNPAPASPAAVPQAPPEPVEMLSDPVVEPALELDHDAAEPRTPLTDLLPPDPLLTESLHKIIFALELVVWDHAPEQAVNAKELHHLRLEPWEILTYRTLSERRVDPASLNGELQLFYLTSAALRVKLDEEAREIKRLADAGRHDRLADVLERSAQSLERAGEVDRRFRWFIDDMLYRGRTESIEQIYRSHFRFLRAFSGLWLEHQANGGITPL